MQVMAVQPLLLHGHPLQLCRLSVHGLELVSGRHLRDCALELPWVRGPCLKKKRQQKTKNKMEGLDAAGAGKRL